MKNPIRLAAIAFLGFVLLFVVGAAHAQFQEIQKQAMDGDAVAQNKLARMYALGQGGLEPNPLEAAKWFRRSANQGYPRSEYNMGMIYSRGEGVPKSMSESLRWYRKAADQGYVRAQRKLGDFYAEGVGVPRNYVQAYMWYNLAAAAGDSEARTARGRLSPKMNGSQIAEAQRLSVQFKPQRRWRGPVE